MDENMSKETTPEDMVKYLKETEEIKKMGAASYYLKSGLVEKLLEEVDSLKKKVTQIEKEVKTEKLKAQRKWV